MIESSTRNSLFRRVVSYPNLREAWRKVAGNRGSAGGDGVSIEVFGRHLDLRLKRLERDLRDGTYRPGPLRRVHIPKDDGSLRPLDIPCVGDRVIQTSAAQILGPILDAEMEDASYAYRPGRSVAQAVARVASLRRQGYRWVVDGDIERYFERVPHGRLIERLEESLADPALLDLIELWLETYGAGRGLPQGSPISPLLANLYLDEVDEQIEGSGVRLVRFADDFVLLCRDEARAAGALSRIAELLEERGLALHADKTRIVPFEGGLRFLGHLFVRSLVLKETAQDSPEMSEAELAETIERALAEEESAAEAGESLVGPDVGPRAHRLRVLYVMTPGRCLGLRNEVFTVEEEGSELLAVPAHRVDRIELGPGATARDPALRHAAASGTTVAYVNGWGQTLGLLEGPGPENAERQLAQAGHGIDPALRLDLARCLVKGRVHNQRALLRRLNRRRKDPEVSGACLALNRCLRKLPAAETVEVLLGLEGEAGALYWPALGRTLEHGWSLARRRRRPPPDPVNLVISFTSAMLTRDTSILMRRHGLHPGFGALHSVRDGAEAAVYDLIEEFRAPLSEGLTVFLFNKRALRPEMFGEREEGRCFLSPEGREAVIRGYEAWVNRTVRSPHSGRAVRWRGLIEEQVVAYAQHVESVAAYRPYHMDY